jgi:hypothetical protein
MPSRRRFSIAALALGNFVAGLSILLPTGMLAELSSGLGVSIGTAGLLISLGAGVGLCIAAAGRIGHKPHRPARAVERNSAVAHARSHRFGIRTEKKGGIRHILIDRSAINLAMHHIDRGWR